MEKILVFVPVTVVERAEVASGQQLRDRRAFTATEALMAALGYGPDMTEDAEYATMVIASVAGLADHGERYVLVAQVEPRCVGELVDADNGEFSLACLRRSDVVAWFADADETDHALAACACAGMSIDDAWERPEVQELLASTDLLWHDAVELTD